RRPPKWSPRAEEKAYPWWSTTTGMPFPPRAVTISAVSSMVSGRGGKGIPVVVDHLEPDKVEKLISRIGREEGGLDVLVNDISESAEHEFGKTFWQVDLDRGFAMFSNAVYTHIITSHFAAPLLIETAAKNKS